MPIVLHTVSAAPRPLRKHLAYGEYPWPEWPRPREKEDRAWPRPHPHSQSVDMIDCHSLGCGHQMSLSSRAWTTAVRWAVYMPRGEDQAAYKGANGKNKRFDAPWKSCSKGKTRSKAGEPLSFLR
ncbi:hypothetical protein P7K49_038138 [Saguinus oedipus]|uniref:Uncharacterized protein n=1 Tax=Saguinus oedipus TaxID=9490 RepID=A0ABQ9TDT4_SAGOE|nr:hypothetical protein P7K49_038138 [Saguinus oedipus]